MSNDISCALSEGTCFAVSNDTLSVLCGHMYFTVSDDTPYALSDITNFAMSNDIRYARSSNMRCAMSDNVCSAVSDDIGMQCLMAYGLSDLHSAVSADRGHAFAQSVAALRYKSEGRGFDSP